MQDSIDNARRYAELQERLTIQKELVKQEFEKEDKKEKKGFLNKLFKKREE